MYTYTKFPLIVKGKNCVPPRKMFPYIKLCVPSRKMFPYIKLCVPPRKMFPYIKLCVPSQKMFPYIKGENCVQPHKTVPRHSQYL